MLKTIWIGAYLILTANKGYIENDLTLDVYVTYKIGYAVKKKKET